MTTFTNRLLSFFRLGIVQKLFVVEATFWLLLAMIIVKFVPFSRWAPHLGATTGSDLPEDSNANLRTVHYVAGTIRGINRTFGDSFTCLMQAVAGKIILNRRGIPNTLFLGVRTVHGDNAGVKIEAHAWLRSGKVVMLGGAISNQLAVNIGTAWGPGAGDVAFPDQSALAPVFAESEAVMLDVVAQSFDVRIDQPRRTLTLARTGDSPLLYFDLTIAEAGRKTITVDVLYNGNLLQSRRTEVQVVETANAAPVLIPPA